MITHLRISNYALIERLELSPESGLNIITGETGAGKSIMLGALGLLRGNRVDPRVVTNPGEKSVVEAEFALSPQTRESLIQLLAEADIDDAGDRCILRREILPSGRSRAFINDTPAVLTTLAAVADRLIDIHSQHKNLLLGDSGFQLRVIDSIADNAEPLRRYAAAYADYKRVLREFVNTRDEIERTRADADFIRYQLDELRRLNPVEGEDEELTARRDELAAGEAIATALATAGNALSWGKVTAVELIESAVDALHDGADHSEELASLAERLEAAKAEIDSVADSISSAAASVGDSPAQLEEIDRRLSRLNTLMVRHKASSAGQLAEIRDSLERRLSDLDDADITLADLEKKARKLKRTALEVATEISERRKVAATRLAEQLAETARPLGLANIVVEISVTTGKLNPDGIDTVDFLLAFNKNQAPQPIGNAASGGEISRVMLALKSILANSLNLPTIIFDEIDTGVSGDVAARMGSMMRSLSEHMQVITITHLPAVAARGNSHYKVFKRDTETASRTFITQLDDAARRSEIAAMLSGDAADPAALAAADAMLTHN